MSCFALLVLLEEMICFSQQMHYEITFLNLFCALQCIRITALKRFVLLHYYSILLSDNFFSWARWIMVFNGKNLFGNVFWFLSHIANPELGLSDAVEGPGEAALPFCAPGDGDLPCSQLGQIRGVQNTFGGCAVQQWECKWSSKVKIKRNWRLTVSHTVWGDWFVTGVCSFWRRW